MFSGIFGVISELYQRLRTQQNRQFTMPAIRESHVDGLLAKIHSLSSMPEATLLLVRIRELPLSYANSTTVWALVQLTGHCFESSVQH